MKRTKEFLFLGVYLLAVIVFVIIKHFNGLYGQDAHEYYRYSRALLEWFNSGKNPGDYFWPLWYPLSAAALAYITHLPTLPVLQLISLLSLSTLIVILLFWDETHSPFERISYTFLAIGLSPFLLREGMLCMADTMSIASTLVALFCFSKFIRKGTSWYVFGFALSAALATMTRYASAVLLFLPALFILYQLLTGKKWLSLLLSIIIALIICIPHILVRYQSPLAFVHHEWINSWSVLNFVGRDFATPDGIQHYKLPNLLFVFAGFAHPEFGILTVPLLLFVRKEDLSSPVAKILLASVFIYALFLAGIPFQNKRFLLAAFPIIIILLYPAFERFFNWVKLKWLLLAATCLVHLFIFTRLFEEINERNQLEKKWAAMLAQRPEKVLYSFDIDIGIKSYDTSKIIYNLWAAKYDSFQPNALVLFNEKKFAAQWKGKNPMLNWEQLQRSDSLALLTDEDGWQLLRIEGPK